LPFNVRIGFIGTILFVVCCSVNRAFLSIGLSKHGARRTRTAGAGAAASSSADEVEMNELFGAIITLFEVLEPIESMAYSHTVEMGKLFVCGLLLPDCCCSAFSTTFLNNFTY